MAGSWQFASVSHIGGRDENQDALVLFHDAERDQILVVVADGMGGHRGGAEAAQLICRCAEELWQVRDQWPPRSILHQLVDESHARANALSAESELDAHSTLAALWIEGQQAVSVHAGDTRIIQYGPGGLVKRTLDHSMAQIKVLSGKITEAQMATDPSQSRLTTSIGGEETPEAEFTEWNLALGADFVICTDGFWEIVDSEQQRALLLSEGDLQTNLHTCLLEALEQQSDPKHDNSTCVLVRRDDVPFLLTDTLVAGAPDTTVGAHISEAADRSALPIWRLLLAVLMFAAAALVLVLILLDQPPTIDPQSPVEQVPALQPELDKPLDEPVGEALPGGEGQ
ncbi:MAG: hypothetical protein CVV16_03300 [Gammaproteobacteria bacterium HGW-Gammaproteobacteria-6]|nr:MAG: hypothetical protein CVV16_03300 [Gammaproteobacteria bacterium HGW-Gammaproteobacteria-6]